MTLVVLIVLFNTASIANRTDRTRPENPGDQAIPRDHGYGPQGGQGRGGAHAATLDLVAGLIRGHLNRIGSPWRKLAPHRIALVVLAVLRMARLGGDVHEATQLALAWCAVEEWQPPALAVLCRSAEVRRRHASAILPTCRDLAALERHDLKCLAYALAVLDDEPLVVLHRPTGTGFEIRIGGIGDNFQLHTLLAHVLVGGGYIPGARPSAESVRLATDPEPAHGRTQAIATGAFELLAPDGERIWNEGLPDDIPVVEGRRLLVLDEPAYRRSWNADRFFPHLPGTAELTRALTADETRTWLARTSPRNLIRRPS